MTSRSTFLFATPTFAEGVGRILDFGNTLTEYNYTATPEMADALAAALDWHAVGDDVRAAIERYVDGQRAEIGVSQERSASR